MDLAFARLSSSLKGKEIPNPSTVEVKIYRLSINQVNRNPSASPANLSAAALLPTFFATLKVSGKP